MTGSGNIYLKGNIEGVTIHTGSRMNMTVDGNVTSTAVFATRTCVKGTHDMCIGGGGFNQQGGVGTSADGFGRLEVSGNLEISNGGGGAIVKHAFGSSGHFMIGNREVGLTASFGGSSLTLLCAHVAGRSSACTEVASVHLQDELESDPLQATMMEKLSWGCSGKPAICNITAAGGESSTLFVVRKTA